MQTGLSPDNNADIERELFQLGLRDTPPPRAFSDTATSPFLPFGDPYSRRFGRKLLGGSFIPGGEGEYRSSSAPSFLFERPRSRRDDFLSPARGFREPRPPSFGTRSLDELENFRRWTPTVGKHGSFRSLATPSISPAWQDPRGVHYPGYVQSQDFLTLPRGVLDFDDEESLYPDEEAEFEERQLVASVEAALRRLHESYIHYDHPDSVAEPPPPQPVGICLKDPPPSPEPAYLESLLAPVCNGIYSRMQPSAYGPTGDMSYRESVVGPSRTVVGPSRTGIDGLLTTEIRAPQLVDSENASKLSQQIGFVPIHTTPLAFEGLHHRHHHHHHRRPYVGVLPREAHRHRHHRHIHHERRRSSRASRMMKNVAAIAPGSGIKILKIHRAPPPGPGFGFSIKGSLERGLGIYVSRVEEDGPAWTAGLRAGDLLLAANNRPVSQMGHAEIITLLKSSEDISLTVAATSQLASTQMMVSQTYTWVTPDGTPASPPSEYNPRFHRRHLSQATVNVGGGDGLGLMIRGGSEYGLGIYITGVDRGSAADKAGLKVGDQIIEANGDSFLAVTHDTAFRILKYCPHLEISYRRVAKVPHSCTTTHRRRISPEESRDSSDQMTLAMIEEKSKSVLDHTEYALLHETVIEYAAGLISMSRFLSIAEKVLDAPEKLSLLTELREVVRPSDLGEFDAAVFSQSSKLSIRKSGYSSADFDAFDKMMRNLQQNMEFNSNTKEDLVPVDISGAKKKKKVIPRLKDRKRDKEFVENGAKVNQTVSKNQDKNNSYTKLKSNWKTRKFLKKRLSETSLLSKEEFSTDEKGITPSRRRHSFSGDERSFLRPPGEKRQLLDDLDDISLPKISRLALREDNSSKNFSHSFSDAAINSTSVRQRPPPQKDPLTPNGRRSRPLTFASPPPLFSPTFPESSFDSPPLSTPSPATPFRSVPSMSFAEPLRTRDDLVYLPSQFIDPSRRLSPLFSDDDAVPTGYQLYDGDFEMWSHRDESLGRLPYRDNLNDQRNVSHSPRGVSRDFYAFPEALTRSAVDLRPREDRNDLRESLEFNDSRDLEYLAEQRMRRELQMMQDPRLILSAERGGFDGYPRDAHPRQRFRGSELFEDSANRRGHPQQRVSSFSSRSYSSLPRPSPLVTRDTQGRFHLKVKKVVPSLGMALEGGSDTKQKLPRVINITPFGAAVENGGLKVGQIILAVDGHKLEGKSHAEATKMIANAWMNKSKAEIDFYIKDRKPSEINVRSSSLTPPPPFGS